LALHVNRKTRGEGDKGQGDKGRRGKFYILNFTFVILDFVIDKCDSSDEAEYKITNVKFKM
jgi:hypothetical protein